MKIYLDTSAIIKRYVEEEGTNEVDKYFEKSYKNDIVLVFSHFNIGECAVVFDKYERKGMINAKETFKTMINELYVLAKLGNLILVPVSYDIIKTSVEYIFKFHIYIADAIQLASFKKENCDKFLTFDEKLKKVLQKFMSKKS